MPAVIVIEESVRTMFTGSAQLTEIADANITHGYRLQSNATLPALTFECERPTEECIGIAPLTSVTVEARIIAATTAEAVALIDDVRAAAVPGSYASAVFDAVIWQGHTVSPASVGEGDENEPAEVVCTIDIYYRL